MTSKSATGVWDSSDKARVCREEFRQLLLRRQEKALADDVVEGVEEAIDRLEPEVRHPDPVGVREGQGHAQTTAVRLTDVAGFLGEDELCAFALLPGFHKCGC